MMERRNLVDLWQQRGTQPAILVTLTGTSGSSYRRPGAHVLLFEDGRHAGTISGGCLEAEVARKAFWMTRDGAAMHRYSTLFDDTAEIPFGLGCGGQIDILLEPAATPECAALFAAMHASLAGRPGIAITLLPAEGQPLQRILCAEDGSILFASATLTAEETSSLVEQFHPFVILRKAKNLKSSSRLDSGCPILTTASSSLGWDSLAQRGPRDARKCFQTTDPRSSPPPAPESFLREAKNLDANPAALPASRVYVEHLLPPQRLVIFGAGDDAQPLAALAAQVGWSIIVADGRAQFALASRFPAADTVLLLAEDLSLAPVHIVKDDAVVLMTHSYAQDRALLAQLLPIAPRYLAVLGARHRTSILVSEVAAQLGWSMEECAVLLHAPAGLNLGGDGPESIALAILAEAHAHCAGRDARPRRITAAEMWKYLESAVRTSSPPLVCSMDSPFAAVAETPDPSQVK